MREEAGSREERKGEREDAGRREEREEAGHREEREGMSEDTGHRKEEEEGNSLEVEGEEEAVVEVGRGDKDQEGVKGEYKISQISFLVCVGTTIAS